LPRECVTWVVMQKWLVILCRHSLTLQNGWYVTTTWTSYVKMNIGYMGVKLWAFVVTVNDTIWTFVIWDRIVDLFSCCMSCSYPTQHVVHFEMHLFKTDIMCLVVYQLWHMIWMMWHLQSSSLPSFNLCKKCWTLWPWKSMYPGLIPSQSSVCLHLYTIQLWPLTCLC